jgi:hypothetical protein
VYSKRSDTKCDPKLSCSTKEDCQEGMKCIDKGCTCVAPTMPSQSFECRVPVGFQCVPNPKGAGQCEEGTECSTTSRTCKAAVNARCDPTAQPSQCNTERTMCDATFNRCLVIPGKPCDSKAPGMNAPCASGYDCQEKNSTCHVRALADCTGNTEWCVENYECVLVNNTQVCLLKNGAQCNDDI